MKGLAYLLETLLAFHQGFVGRSKLSEPLLHRTRQRLASLVQCLLQEQRLSLLFGRRVVA